MEDDSSSLNFSSHRHVFRAHVIYKMFQRANQRFHTKVTLYNRFGVHISFVLLMSIEQTHNHMKINFQFEQIAEIFSSQAGIHNRYRHMNKFTRSIVSNVADDAKIILTQIVTQPQMMNEQTRYTPRSAAFSSALTRFFVYIISFDFNLTLSARSFTRIDGHLM